MSVCCVADEIKIVIESVNLMWSAHAECWGGDKASYCRTMPRRDCYVLATVCCQTCSRQFVHAHNGTTDRITLTARTYIHTYIQPFNGPFSATTRVSRYQKGKTNLDFTEARDSEWQWHQLGHMQVCTSLQTDNHASTPPLSLFTGRMPFLPPNQQRQSTDGISLTARCV